MADDPSGDIVLDASVAAKLYFEEAGSAAARRILKLGALVLAPDLLFIELASVGAKRVRRGLSTLEEAAYAVTSISVLIDQVAPTAELCERAFHLAARHGFSAYDGAYLALAERSGAVLLTADTKLIRLAGAAGFANRLHALPDR